MLTENFDENDLIDLNIEITKQKGYELTSTFA
jgi:hypothetical protein